ncbi:DNA-directed RNA polymerase, mitochondrial-like [Littorina saxatilis]|uniref:DNA-directed RNA polymerase, mitochondrial-like n=1 Tax=Littorina saxatilis TaxID=31220 RepID=UPI0038B46ECF
MAQLLRLTHYSKVLSHSVTYSTSISASVRTTLERLRPCNSCWNLRLRGSGNTVMESGTTYRYSSGVARAKPDHRQNLSKPPWKKKKKKNSNINKKIHADLLKVLNRRAVQLVFTREANQLHRTLVTNFSFMDFPLQHSVETFPIPLNQKHSNDRVPSFALSTKHQDFHKTKTHEDSWATQLLAFEKQLQTGPQQSADHNAVLSQSGASLSESSTHVSHSLSSSSLEALVSDVLKHLPQSTHSKTAAVESSSSLPQSETAAAESVSSLPSLQPSDPYTVSPVPKSTKSAKASVSVNANIVKTKKTDRSKKNVRPMSATAGEPLPAAEEDVLSGEPLEGVMEDVDGTVRLRSLSKLEMKRLKKARSEREKYQLDPAKYNHVFNQELLAYVDACCFAGLDTLALSTLKLQRLRKDFNNKILPGMRKIQDIRIYNRLMQSFAKKCEMGGITELFALLREETLKANMQSYAAVWECLGRQQDMDVGVGQKVLEDMEREGLDVRDLFNRAIFFKDEQPVILKAIRIVDPDYQALPPPPPQPPIGPLVENLNTAPPIDQVVEKNPYAEVLSTDKVRMLAETQMQRELWNTVPVKSILKPPPPSRRTLEYRKKLDNVREDWKGWLTKAFEKKVRYMARKSKMEYGMTMYPYLKLFDTQDYVQCLLQEVEDLTSSSDTFSPSKTFLWRRLGHRVYSKFAMTDKIKNKVPKKVSLLYKEYLDEFMDKDLDLSSHRQLWQSLMVNSPDGPTLDVPEKIWPSHIFLALGKLLYEHIIYDLKVDTNMMRASATDRNLVPAFYTIYRNYSYQTFEEIKPHPVLVKLFRGAELDELTFEAGYLPMLVPPVPWISTTHGGYLLSAVRLVRIPMQAQAQTEKVQETVATSQLSTVLDSINTLSACAWVINAPVLDIIIDMFNNKGNASLDVPPPASECPPPPKITQEMSAQEKSVAHRQRLRLRQQRAEMYSLWCQELYKLSIANKFRDEVFWFPHNLDFRGRTYPCPPHFNHLGSDITRSILMFAKGKPLGSKGLDWMKIHLINLTGFKKRSPNRERLAYANEMMDEILDSADNPKTGNKWWQKSDEPWQTLACCMEIARASRSPDPENYICHLPVHQDGSCNGLQHYAALGRDKAGAQSVNLWPYDSPQDVYSDVLELVEKERQKDAAEGVEIAQHLEGFVRRKVIKQTIMTTVYGVTRYGAKAQILRQLKDIPEFPQAHVWNASLYLTEKTFQCLNEMFSATKDIQDWLTLSAQLIATVCQRPVEWVTPVGLTVVQPYHKAMGLSRFGVNTTDSWNYFEKPNAMKQKNAFPPNFIHSLDSTHMMLTSLYCMRAGITFVSVHDCFWTHACDVEIMNQICREQFVALHKQPILEDLSRQLVENYTPDVTSDEVMEAPVLKAREFLRNVLLNVPARGDFDLEKVLDSTYFFS